MKQPKKRSARAEVYGFVGWVSTWVTLGVYLIWAFVPSEVLIPLGITYYPDRYWAAAGPMYLLVAWLFTMPVYIALNLVDTAPLNSYSTLTDKDAREVGISDLLKEQGDVVPIADIPITVVNEILYSQPKISIPNSPPPKRNQPILSEIRLTD